MSLPSDEMMAAGDGCELSFAVWKAMISAALAEPVPSTSTNMVTTPVARVEFAMA
jgi:hypothetical protein